MKKLLFLLILNLLLNIKLVWADVCFYVSSQAAQKSVQFLKKNSEIINYCELCSNSEAQSEIIQNVSFKQVPKSDYYVLSINNNEKDIAYVYVKTNDNNYENLAYIVGCTEAKKNKISQFRSVFPTIKEQSQTQIFEDIKDKIDEITQNCLNGNTVNECLYSAIKEQIIAGFEANEQKIMLETLDNARKSVFRFYDTIYNQNKYCLGKCGTMAYHLAENDENTLLKNMLSRLMYLNKVKNGY